MRTLEALLAAWGDAEARGDAAALGPLLAADFRGDGPLGSVLGKDQWLDRHRRGDLTVDSFAWSADEVRVFGRTAVAIGTQSQVARYRGRDCSGAFACTLVAVRRRAGWRIVNLQLGSWPPGRCSPPATAPGLGHGRHEKEGQSWRATSPSRSGCPGPTRR